MGVKYKDRQKVAVGGYSAPKLTPDSGNGTRGPNAPISVGPAGAVAAGKPSYTPTTPTVDLNTDQYINGSIVNATGVSDGAYDPINYEGVANTTPIIPEVKNEGVTYGGNAVSVPGEIQNPIPGAVGGVKVDATQGSSEKEPEKEVTYEENSGDTESELVGDGVKAEDPARTYEYWLQHVKDQAGALADRTYAEAQRQSEVERQRAIVDADVSYQKNVSDYGANAERLASMGLTNSGYADYQKSQSYAQMRGEVQYANAQKVASDKQAAYNRDQTKLGAEITYAQGMANKALSDEQTKNTTYLELLSGAGNGTYSEEQIRALGTQAGLSSDEISRITAVATAFEIDEAAKTTQARVEYLIDMAVSGTSEEIIGQIAGAWGVDATVATAIARTVANETLSKEKKGYVESLIVQAANGVAPSVIEAVAGVYKLDKSDYSEALNVAKQVQEQNQSAAYISILEELGANDAAIDSMIEADILTPEQAEVVRRNARYNAYMTDIEYNGVYSNIQSALDDMQNKIITEDMYKEIYSSWCAQAEETLEDILYQLNNGAVYSKSALRSLLDHLATAPKSQPLAELYSELSSYYRKKYDGVKESTSETSAATNTGGGVEVSGETPPDVPIEG